MKKLFRVFIALLLSFTALFSFTQPILASETELDYTTFTEVDSATDITILADNISYDTMQKSAVSYVYFDYGEAGITDNFSYNLDILVSQLDNIEGNAVFSLTNSENGIGTYRKTLGAGSSNATGISILVLPTSGIGIDGKNEGSAYCSGNYAIALDTPYYLSLYYDKLASTYGTLYFKVYADTSRTSLLYSKTQDMPALPSYRYLYGIQSYGAAGTLENSGWIANLSSDVPTTPSGVSLNVITGIQVTSLSGGNPVYTFTGVTDNLSNLRGFQLGLVAYEWNNNLTLEETANVDSWNGSAGAYALSTSILSANTTYYWRAYAAVFTASQEWYYAYGEVKSFITSSASLYTAVPIVTTDTVGYSIFNNGTTGSIQVNSTIVQSISTVVKRGFRWSTTSSDMTGLLVYTVSNTGTFPVGTFYKDTSAGLTVGVPFPTGTIIYVQSFAENIYGLVGYGAIKSYTVPLWSIGTGGIYVTNGLVEVNGNTAKLLANVTNPLNITIDRVSFTWGLTIACSDDSSNTPVSGSQFAEFSYSLVELLGTTDYYFKAGVFVNGQWIWSTPTMFTTGAAIPIIGETMPMVRTLAATNIGENYFQANGELLSLGYFSGSNVTVLGFAYAFNTNEAIEDWARLVSNGSFSVGTFNRVLTLSRATTNMYFSAVATNQYGTSFGEIFEVNFSAGTTGGTGSSSGTGFSDLVSQVRNNLGLTGIMGTWAFLGLILLLVALVFGMTMFAIEEKIGKMAVGVAWLLTSISVVGAFIFTGQLGIWPIIILVGGVVLLIMIIISVKFSGGGTNG